MKQFHAELDFWAEDIDAAILFLAQHFATVAEELATDTVGEMLRVSIEPTGVAEPDHAD